MDTASVQYRQMAKVQARPPVSEPREVSVSDADTAGGSVAAGSLASGLRDAATDEGLWRLRILERSRHACGNCGHTDRVRVHFVVPLEAGGQLHDANGYVLCRSCEIAREIAKKPSAAARRPINFWVSRHLYALLDALTQPGQRFPSMGAMIRYLIAFYVASPERFDDLPNYQDRGTDMKVNAWVGADAYETFKARLDGLGMTVTDALKGLILLYAELEPGGSSSPTKDPRDV